jgi:hypothetical protein
MPSSGQHTKYKTYDLGNTKIQRAFLAGNWDVILQTIIYVYITGMRHITTFRATTDRIYDGGPIILWYHCVTIAYSIQYSNMLYSFVA